jgi:hypothetical protein
MTTCDQHATGDRDHGFYTQRELRLQKERSQMMDTAEKNVVEIDGI